MLGLSKNNFPLPEKNFLFFPICSSAPISYYYIKSLGQQRFLPNAGEKSPSPTLLSSSQKCFQKLLCDICKGFTNWTFPPKLSVLLALSSPNSTICCLHTLSSRRTTLHRPTKACGWKPAGFFVQTALPGIALDPDRTLTPSIDFHQPISAEQACFLPLPLSLTVLGWCPAKTTGWQHTEDCCPMEN